MRGKKRAKFTCNQCSARSDSICNLQIHLITHMPKPYTCFKCPFKATVARKLYIHMTRECRAMRCADRDASCTLNNNKTLITLNSPSSSVQPPQVNVKRKVKRSNSLSSLSSVNYSSMVPSNYPYIPAAAELVHKKRNTNNSMSQLFAQVL